MSTYIIGDLQGCFASLEQLLSTIQFSPQKDTLIFCGDIVNRGPDSLACLNFIYSHPKCTQMVLGNHDMALLCMAESFIEPQPGDTVQAVLAAPNATKILTWLRAQPLMIYNENAGFCVVHAGIWPLWNLSDCLKANDFIREALQGPQYHQVLRHLYGNAPTADNSTMPFLDRCRFITNAFTRMRYCDARGHLEFSEKNHPRDAPSGIIPWFSHPKRRPFHPTIFFGHWASLKGECAAHNIEALDTGCVWGGQLTAFRLEDQKRFSVQSTFPSHKDAE